MSLATQINQYLSLVKFSHTIFALPFALVGFALGVLDSGHLRWETLVLILLCMVFARSAAMAFNRYLDRDIDAKNPRTANREIPAGTISAKAALLFVVASSLLFVLCAGLIHPLCLWLSPIALAVVLGYSFTKRFTSWCHFVLGLGLALAPVGAYIAVTGQVTLIPILYGVVVLLWVSGFDIIYALQDEDFDKSHQLNSMPGKLGRTTALQLAKFLHFLCALTLLSAIYLQWQNMPDFDWLTWVAGGIFIVLLGYQHTLVSADDLSRINLAFFTTNGVASLIFGLLVLMDAFFL